MTSARGQAGGYTLSRPAHQIVIGEVLALLGGRLFEPEFCTEHSGNEKACTNTVDCSIRSLWRAVQLVVDHVLNKTTLKELVSNEREMSAWVIPLIKVAGTETEPDEPSGQPAA